MNLLLALLGGLAIVGGLLAARRDAKPAPGTATPQPTTGNGAIDVGPQQSFVNAAMAEQQFWAGRHETHPAVNERLVDYWKAASNGSHPLTMFGDGWESKQPWSAAFVSYVAGKALPGALTPAQGHWTYTKAAMGNRGVPGRFEVLDARTEPVNFGDIILRNRQGNAFTFDDLSRHGFQPSHGDIVVEFHRDHVDAVGGNLGHTVKRVSYPINPNGMLEGVGTPDGPIALLRHFNHSERHIA